MLKFKYLSKNEELVKKIISLWNYDEENLDEQTSHFRVSSNAVYPFTYEGKQFFLRFAPACEKNEDNIQCELQFLRYLFENGFKANQPVESKNGKYLEKIVDQEEEYFACVFCGVDGKKADDVYFGEKTLIKCGENLAQLHNLAERFLPETKAQSIDDTVAFIEGQLKCETEQVQGIFENLKQRIEKTPRTQKTFGLCHQDYETDNLFYDRKADCFWLIDFEDSRYSYYAYDIAVATEDFCSDSRNLLSADKIHKAFLQGYSSVREAPPQEEIEIFYLFSLFVKYADLLYVLKDQDYQPDFADEEEAEEEPKGFSFKDFLEPQTDDFPDEEKLDSEYYDELEEAEEEVIEEEDDWSRKLRFKLIMRANELREDIKKSGGQK